MWIKLDRCQPFSFPIAEYRNVSELTKAAYFKFKLEVKGVPLWDCYIEKDGEIISGRVKVEDLLQVSHEQDIDLVLKLTPSSQHILKRLDFCQKQVMKISNDANTLQSVPNYEQL